MVFHFIESVLGTTGRQKDELLANANVHTLIEKGFSEEEARNLVWINGNHGYGKWLGALAGLGLVKFGKGYMQILEKTFPRLYYFGSARFALGVGVVYAGYFLGDLFLCSNYRLNYSNNQWTATVSPRQYLVARDNFVRHFEPVNRKFTFDEIRLFNANAQNQKLDGPRQWNYNPAIHGDDEEAFKREASRFTNPKRDEFTRNMIHEQNSEKIQEGEPIAEKPFRVNDFIDRTGRKQEMEKFPILTGWKPLY